MMKSILDLNIDELQSIIMTDVFPEDVTLEGIEGRKDFQKLFVNRMHPCRIAEIIYKEKAKQKPKEPKPLKEPKPPRVFKPVEPKIYKPFKEPYKSIEPVAVKNERLELKKAELEFKNKKLESQTLANQNIFKELQEIKSDIQKIITCLLSLKGGE